MVSGFQLVDCESAAEIGTVGPAHSSGATPIHCPCSEVGSETQALSQAGVRRGESNAEYHSRDGRKSCSHAKTFLDSPLLYHSRYVTKTLPSPSSDALRHGTLLHEWFEFGDALLDRIAVPPESTLTSTLLVGKKAEEWAKEHAAADAIILSPKEAAQFHLERKALEEHPAVRELREQIVDRELSCRFDTPDGDFLKCRFDALTPEFAIDLKTTREQDILAGFWKSVVDFKYHLQDAWYQRGMEAMGMEAQPLRFIVVSTTLPHDVQVVTLPEQVIAEGRRLMDRALADLRLRESLDWWLPDTHGEVVELSFPAHVLGRFS